MSAHGPCTCRAHSVEYLPSTVPGRVDAAGPIIDNGRDAVERDDVRLDCIRHEAAHALAALAFHRTFNYVTVGEAGFHCRLSTGTRTTRRARIIEDLLIDAAGYAVERSIGKRRAPGIIELGHALRRDDDERGDCDTCAIAGRINEAFPSADDLVRLQTAMGVMDLARALFERHMWRHALERMTTMLSEHILLHGDKVAGLFDRDALLRDFESLVGEFDVLHNLPCFSSSFRNVERGRDDRADAAPAVVSAPLGTAGAPYQDAHPCA